MNSIEKRLENKMTVLSWACESIKLNRHTLSVQLVTKKGTAVQFDDSEMKMNGSLSMSQMKEISNVMDILEELRQVGIIGNALQQGMLQ